MQRPANIGVVLSLALATGCWTGEVPPTPPARPVAMPLIMSPPPPRHLPHDEKSLYDRLGGIDAIRAVVGTWIAKIAGDPRINAFFANANVSQLSGHLTDLLCEMTGGPCRYLGRDMRTTHAGMAIQPRDLDAMLDDLAMALAKFRVSDVERDQLFAALRAMSRDITGP